MMRSLSSAVTGLNAHQMQMDVIANNIANVNTVGYKGSRVTFADAFSQTLRDAVAPYGDRGGVNPIQMGMGVGINSIDMINTQGSMQGTGHATDMGIDGNGYFVLSDGDGLVYTRAGTFNWDSSGTLVYSNGMKVQGWGGVDGQINVQGGIKDISISKEHLINPATTSDISLKGNLDVNTSDQDVLVASTVFDSLGRDHNLLFTFAKEDENLWTWEVHDNAGTSLESGTLEFDSYGKMDTSSGGPISLVPPGADSQEISLDFTEVTQFAQTSNLLAAQDGYASGAVNDVTIDGSGTVMVWYSNGMMVPKGQLALASFNNAGGLGRIGDTLFTQTDNSGAPRLNSPGEGGNGSIVPNSVEMSNVDLANEFTQMVVAQRGFQANSRIITTSDKMIEEVVNLKR